MIPKKIHYVWVGDKPKPQFVLDCIQTWKKFLPDYEIVEWGNQSLEGIHNDYVDEAFKHKKWAFVSDYLRLFALYNEGGIYLDTDVEVTNNFDKFLNLDFFSCYENYKQQCYPITSAVMGANRQNKIILELLREYENIHFENKNGLNLETNIIKITRYFEDKFGFLPPYNGYQQSELTHNSCIFPFYYFCTPEYGKTNYAIHHFNGSWLPSHSRKNKLSIFGKIIFARLIKIREKGDLPMLDGEKIIFKIKISSQKYYCVILKK
ncbi:glycosyl transferase [Xenorhabdus bovienii]|uniref:Putative mannosyltransferase involved in polysaccharide biosynthesis n=2 Tax=Xenorhabdus bovienii TaxID=40576 RepID=A0A077PN80_XENBV|nr:glycosyltransferase [Xenorhabdus bovienii]MDE9441326.1 glycosyl transferase [Xenorhabdus bovienii]MDE9482578.1 glycosyl transferase [Xenorhabdus bovienii]CDH04386.1 putative mannosyltransferase involved in polysaccharide biosynthesis [Xenorhabdus bovienii str. oregonense]CDH21249.1 putative mannosyltransferase involved in polysaccharide biosynthesis [Xenorhabdus bovienii str. kraussei Quebec]